MNILQIVLLALSTYSVVRLVVYMLSSNIYSLKSQYRVQKSKKTYYRPRISVIIPAHNEETVILRTLQSVEASNYPSSKLEIIVANDGSVDETARIVRSYARQRGLKFKVWLISRPNRGKAEALNYAIAKKAHGQLIMCLDADSTVDPDCVKNIVQNFRDRRVVAAASNVNILENGTLLGLAQRLEYLFSHQLKKAHTLLNMEYIVGGVGSVFRRSMLERVNYYDSNTMTEDIDLTMKIVAEGNKDNRVVFASNAITYTEPVLTYSALITQRYRWKYGRLQSFLKNKHLFFSKNSRYSRQLTWFLLPITLIYEAIILIEPLIIFYLLYVVLSTGDSSTLISASVVFFMLFSLNIWLSDHVSVRDRARLTLYAPASYALIYMLTVIEYITSIKSVLGLPMLSASLASKKTTWKSPERGMITSTQL